MMDFRKKGKIWVEENREKVIFALGLNLLVMILFLIFMRPFYEVNDDLMLSGLANGSMALADAHMIFLNYILGLILIPLYRICGAVSWYAILQYLVVFFSFSAVTYVTMRRLKSNVGIWISLLMLIFFGYECYIKVQFTKTASVAGIAGIFLIFYALEQKKVSFPAYFGGLILACFGVMYRWRQFFACAALMTGIGVFLLLKLREYQKQESLRRFLTYVGGFGVLLGAAIGLIMLDNHMYNTDSAWSYYREYNL
ncbi:MAG: hypothetical protein PHE06_06460, partial [Lachnospiraceae bacterium]|nr:hypothetical protein [Lachnospiraceae bacterium]